MPGQPNVTSRRQEIFIGQRHVRHQFTTATSTGSQINGRHDRRIDSKTVSRKVTRHAIKCRRLYKGLKNTPSHRQEG